MTYHHSDVRTLVRRLSVCRSQTEFIMKLSKTFSTLSIQWNVRGGWCVFMDVWRRMACSFDPCHSLRPVLCLFSPWSPRPPHPPVPSPPPTKGPLGRGGGGGGGGGGTSFMTSLPFFSSSLPFGFQAHSFLPRPRESGATIYIVAWELRPRGPFCCEVGWGSGGWGRGRGAGEGCPLFQPAEWASVPTDLGADGGPRAPAA